MIDIASRARRLSLAAALIASSARAQSVHGTHASKHGGQFFPAAGDTLHIEGVWAQQRVFKVYVYDPLNRPLPLEQLRDVTGHVAVGDQEFPLALLANDEVFEARIPPLKLPAEIPLVMTLAKDGKPEGFYFIFHDYTDESALSFALEPTVIPDTLAGIVAALHDDVRDVESLIERHQSAYVFAPAARGGDHALALERFIPQLARTARARAADAIRTVVRTSWLLHIATDNGTEAQVRAAAAAFRAAVDDVAAAFAPIVR